eukprot:TRINITY_DN274_c0_g1_i5.p1 TRINITY_DN274_c0_g1~~TRINITY_DN274_c0_g1_i5.p1  ORF type:complete len:983 (-),score=72.53 TRINITY_DN274_c0_g1_i5:4552-7500(-)
MTLSGKGNHSEWIQAIRNVKYINAQGDMRCVRIVVTLGPTRYFRGTGHFYQWFGLDSVTTTFTASDAAALTKKLPHTNTTIPANQVLKGYLATITSAEENKWIGDKQMIKAWVGGRTTSPGIFSWVRGPEGLLNGGTGLPFYNGNTKAAINGSYTDFAPGEPNLSGPYVWLGYPAVDWDDCTETCSPVLGYLVEWGSGSEQYLHDRIVFEASSNCGNRSACSGHGTCGPKGDCQCTTGFTGTLCDKCAPTYSNFPSCIPCNATALCNGHGCGTAGQCVCREGWSGLSCEKCAPGYYGPNCVKCPVCYNGGRCDDSKTGTGKCICSNGFNPSTLCHECKLDPPEAYYGSTCSSLCPTCGAFGICKSGVAGDGTCTCRGNFSVATRCQDCLPGFYGQLCVPCDCNNHGTCTGTATGVSGNGLCTCEGGWDPVTRCSTCLPGKGGSKCDLDDFEEVIEHEYNVCNQDGLALFDEAEIPAAIGTIDGIVVSIEENYDETMDVLLLGKSIAGITATFDSQRGLLLLSGSASAAAYQEALRSVVYRNKDKTSNPRPDREITYTLQPGKNVFFLEHTGHYYEVVTPGTISWTAARDAAAARNLAGLPGYLATITSSRESHHLYATVKASGWVGLNSAAVEDVWRWVTGPEGAEDNGQGLLVWLGDYSGNAVNGSYNRWNFLQPDNAQGTLDEDFVSVMPLTGKWQDLPQLDSTVTSYIVEYGSPGHKANIHLSAMALVEMFCSDCNPTTTCNNHGECNPYLSPACLCKAGYAGANCDRCNTNYLDYPLCVHCERSAVCNNHGCLSDGSCVCDAGFTGITCNDCLPGFHGPSCRSCQPCHNGGYCLDGLNGNGSCVCQGNWDPITRCTECLTDPPVQWAGPTCTTKCPTCLHGSCSDGIKGDGECDCDPGWSTTSNCTDCMGGFYGPYCRPCDCNGHGTCRDGVKGSGACECQARIGNRATDLQGGLAQLWASQGSSAATIGGTTHIRAQ